MDKRNTKRITILSIFTIGLILLGATLYFVFSSGATCEDGKQNQSEEGIDCGGPCRPCLKIVELKDVQILSVETVHDVDDKYDAAIKIYNPNNNYGAKTLKYQVELLDANGSVLANSDLGEGYVLPGQQKYLILTGIRSSVIPSGAAAKILLTEWEKFSRYEEPNLLVINSRYEAATGGSVIGGKAAGTLVNKSSIDFEAITVNIILRDDIKKLLGVNYQVINTVRAEEQRDFVINFPRDLEGETSFLEVQPETNVFESENYIKIHGKPEKWDEIN